MESILEYPIQYTFKHRLIFTQDVFDRLNSTLLEILLEENKTEAKVIVFLDDGVVKKNPEIISKVHSYLQSPLIRLTSDPIVIQGGEESKINPDWIVKTIDTLYRYKLCRHSFVIAVGGGAILDSICFAASIVHRGIRQIRIPTTVLAQADAGIGIKNGIDYKGSKNYLGTFYPPYAVINDSLFLQTLNPKEWIAGMAEAIKVALIKDSEFFEWIEANALALVNRNLSLMAQLIKKAAELHLTHIATSGDPFERGSARPLDFGHWSAHKLEQLTDFEIGHGHAVATGIALDSIYSNQIGLLSSSELSRILTCLHDLGFALSLKGISPHSLLAGLEEFREHLGGVLSIPLLEKIGQVITVNAIDPIQMESSLFQLV